MFDVLLIRLLPAQPRTAAEFNADLQGLVITAFDLTIDSNDPVHGGVLLGTAEGVMPLHTMNSDGIFMDPTPLTLRRLTPGEHAPSKFIQSIIQHFFRPDTDFRTTPTLAYAAVATAVIIVEIEGTHEEFPTSTAYDLRIEMERNGVKLTSPSIVFNISVLQVQTLSVRQWDYTGIALDTKALLTSDPNPAYASDPNYNSARTPAVYATIPSAPPANMKEVASVDIVNGQPPSFEALFNAINSVLQLEHPSTDTTAPYTLQVSDPLTPPQCQYIASEIVWNRIRFPTPNRPSSPNLEQIYSLDPKGAPSYTPNINNMGQEQTASQAQQHWESNLSAYQSSRDAETRILAKYIFAASAAVYAEKKSLAASLAALSFPIDETFQT
jgi:hypothetical protein